MRPWTTEAATLLAVAGKADLPAAAAPAVGVGHAMAVEHEEEVAVALAPAAAVEVRACEEEPGAAVVGVYHGTFWARALSTGRHLQTIRPADIVEQGERPAASVAGDGSGVVVACPLEWEALRSGARLRLVSCTCRGRTHHRLLPVFV